MITTPASFIKKKGNWPKFFVLNFFGRNENALRFLATVLKNDHKE